MLLLLSTCSIQQQQQQHRGLSGLWKYSNCNSSQVSYINCGWCQSMLVPSQGQLFTMTLIVRAVIHHVYLGWCEDGECPRKGSRSFTMTCTAVIHHVCIGCRSRNAGPSCKRNLAICQPLSCNEPPWLCQAPVARSAEYCPRERHALTEARALLTAQQPSD